MIVLDLAEELVSAPKPVIIILLLRAKCNHYRSISCAAATIGQTSRRVARSLSIAVTR
jgi:hypothetical protein